jgi:hypothetical protein
MVHMFQKKYHVSRMKGADVPLLRKDVSFLWKQQSGFIPPQGGTPARWNCTFSLRDYRFGGNVSPQPASVRSASLSSSGQQRVALFGYEAVPKICF